MLFENISTPIKIIGALHGIFWLYISFYGFVIRKNYFDILYILFQTLIVLSWTFYNGECILTYLVKKKIDRNYIAGTESTDAKDMYLLFGSKELLLFASTISVIINSLSIYLVLKRNNYSKIILYSLPLFYLLYTLSLRIQIKDIYKNKLFLISQEFFKYYFMITIIYIIYTHCMLYIK